nr:activating signal cointegrator 1 complex subunit 2 homolog [Dermacentor andersoni]
MPIFRECGAPSVQQPKPQVQQPKPQVQQPKPQVQQPKPQVQQPTPREPRAPRRQPRQQELEGAMVTATAEYVRQGQLAEARAQEEARFRQQMLEKNRQVAGMREVQQHFEVARRSHETNRRLLELLLAALGHGGGQAPPTSQAPHN